MPWKRTFIPRYHCPTFALWGANYYSSHKCERFPSLVMFTDLVTMIQ